MDDSLTERRRRGRPAKFGRPSRMVALTLPEDAIERLHRVNHDLGWAIVKLLDESEPGPATTEAAEEDVELVAIADRRALIVINQEVIRSLPDVNIIPLSGKRAFLALEIGRGMSDLELAVIDRLHEGTLATRERRALTRLRQQLRTWRRDHQLRFHTRAIIVVEQTTESQSTLQSGGTALAARRLARRTRRQALRAGAASKSS